MVGVKCDQHISHPPLVHIYTNYTPTLGTYIYTTHPPLVHIYTHYTPTLGTYIYTLHTHP